MEGLHGTYAWITCRGLLWASSWAQVRTLWACVGTWSKLHRVNRTNAYCPSFSWFVALLLLLLLLLLLWSSSSSSSSLLLLLPLVLAVLLMLLLLLVLVVVLLSWLLLLVLLGSERLTVLPFKAVKCCKLLTTILFDLVRIRKSLHSLHCLDTILSTFFLRDAGEIKTVSKYVQSMSMSIYYKYWCVACFWPPMVWSPPHPHQSGEGHKLTACLLYLLYTSYCTAPHTNHRHTTVGQGMWLPFHIDLLQAYVNMTYMS